MHGLQRDGSAHAGKRLLLAAPDIEVVRGKPLLEAGLSRRPFRIEHGEPRGIAISALDDHVLAENALEGKAESQSGPARGLVQSIAFPLVAAVAEILEHMPRHQVHRFRRAGRTLQQRSEKNAADLNATVRGLNPKVRSVADRFTRRVVEDREEKRIA